MVGVPFMQNTLGASARLVVEIAWGADLTAAAATWTWTEITADVLQAGGKTISITKGRADEASATQPAKCTLQVDNRLGGYSLGAQSSNWPNVRRGTPLRVRVDPDGLGFDVRFFGEITGFSPSWDSTGRDARVDISAAGTLRRLAQGKAPILSAYKRGTLGLTDVVAYWPCEDGKDSKVIASALPTGTPMIISGSAENPYPKFEENTDFLCSDALPMSDLTRWTGVVTAHTGTSEVQVRLLIRMPQNALSGTTCTIATLHLSGGTISRVEMYYSIGGLMGLRGFTSAGASAFDTTGVAFASDDTLRLWAITLAQSGANVTYVLSALAVGYDGGGIFDGVAATQTLGTSSAVVIGPDLTVLDAVIGHVSVHTSTADPTGFIDRLNAHFNDTATSRLTRLCAENDVPLTLVGSSDVLVGPQSISPLVTVLREAETADQGLLYDGTSNGLTYLSRDARENIAATLTLNAAAGDPAREVTPTDDDQRTTNKATATRQAGSKATYEDVAGPMGTSKIGIYDSSITVNITQDSDVIDYASWLVHLGTIVGYRWPKLQLDLAKRPAFAPAWSAAGLNVRVDVTNLSTVRTQTPAGTLSLLVEGYTETISQFSWDVVMNCSPYSNWVIGTLAADSGDTSATLMRASSDGSTLASSALSGATSLSVATPSGPLWTTTADDLPFDISVGGMRVTVTAISGASSPQTFTVTGATVIKALSAGLVVDLWQPPVPGL